MKAMEAMKITHPWIVKRRRLYFYGVFSWVNFQSGALRLRLKRTAVLIADEYKGARVVKLKPRSR
jgi:hypothetical protein